MTKKLHICFIFIKLIYRLELYKLCRYNYIFYEVINGYTSMGSLSITHWLILLVVVVIVFGTKKLKNAGKDLGGAVKGFKDAVNEEAKVIESDATEKTTEETVKKTENV